MIIHAKKTNSEGGDNQNSGDFKKCVAALKLKKKKQAIPLKRQTKQNSWNRELKTVI